MGRTILCPRPRSAARKDRRILGRLASPDELANAKRDPWPHRRQHDWRTQGLRPGVSALAGPPPARIPEQQRESVRAGIAGHEHGDGQFVLDPKTGVLGLTWRIRLFGAWQLSQQPVQRTFCSNGRGTW